MPGAAHRGSHGHLHGQPQCPAVPHCRGLGGRGAEGDKKGSFVQTVTQCELTPMRTTIKEMRACHPSRDGTHHPTSLSQHSPGVTLMSCTDAVELWHVRLMAFRGAEVPQALPSPPEAGDGRVHGVRVLAACPQSHSTHAPTGAAQGDSSPRSWSELHGADLTTTDTPVPMPTSSLSHSSPPSPCPPRWLTLTLAVSGPQTGAVSEDVLTLAGRGQQARFTKPCHLIRAGTAGT